MPSQAWETMYKHSNCPGGTETPRRRSPEAGFTFVELLISFTVLMLGLLAIAALTMTLYSSSIINDEERSALSAAQAQVERMKTYDFHEVFASFDASTENDPVGGNAVGPWFEVDGLQAAPGLPKGKAGRVIFPVGPPPTSSTLTVPVLREDIQDNALGMPADLDGDGTIDDQPKDQSYIHLPVIVEVRWTGRLGVQSTRLVTWLTPTEEIKF